MPDAKATNGAPPLAGRPFPWVCPKCRHKEVRPARVAYRAERLCGDRLVEVKIPDLLVPKCENCGELVFDYNAEEQIRRAAQSQCPPASGNGSAGGSNGHCPITPYHAACYAHELTRRSASDSIAKIGSSIFNATVDLNPHQLDAALFAFRAPLSRGAILADEVGLGKTIEAGLVISQLWAEHKRRVLVITPAILRKQWQQELLEKFFLPAQVIEAREFNTARKAGRSPLEPEGRICILSYHFAAARAEEIAAVPWDLVVIDEAHRLRNVYKSTAKIATAIQQALRGRPKLLLTATPLQNDLLELYGLVSFIDPHVFGDIESFKVHYKRGAIEDRQLDDLRERVRPIVQRTLRRQVTEYVSFTNRIPITQDFTPTFEEQELYDRVSAYLQRDRLHALPSGQRKLMTLVLRKLLASSTHAIADTLRGLAERLRDAGSEGVAAEPASQVQAVENHAQTGKTIVHERSGELVLAGVGGGDTFFADYETADELEEEWEAEPREETSAEQPREADTSIQAEINELEQYSNLASSITENAKGRALLSALKPGFAKLQELGARRRAVIFTESRRTQEYLYALLQDDYPGRVLTINGTNADDRSGAIYRHWLQRHQGEDVVTGNKGVDLRAALVEYFRDHAEILVATEAAAEGVNLQFCSLVVNYDLPWNPQRIEQRIGRCHRYGQKHDVVVINFLNRGNAADERVFELLSEKFQLFEGVFGSSDEVLGALESGVDFERRIAEIYQGCRTREEIDGAFNDLRAELEGQIAARMADTRKNLLEHFDEEVHQRLKDNLLERNDYLARAERWLWDLTRHELSGHAEFLPGTYTFRLHSLGVGWPEVAGGSYSLVTKVRSAESPHAYRLGHPLAQAVIERAKDRSLAAAQVRFDHTCHPGKVGAVDGLVGRAGWLAVARLTVESLEDEDRLLFAGIDDGGEVLPAEVCAKLFEVGGDVVGKVAVSEEVRSSLQGQLAHLQEQALGQVASRNKLFFQREIDKLDRWADDRKTGLELQLKDLATQIKVADREARLAPTLEEKLQLQKEKKELERQRKEKQRQLFEAEDEIEARKTDLIAEVERRLQRKTSSRELFTLRWEAV
jgi:superfamily II DNA or RNA helicase